jgi:hypothetical protein
MGENGLQLDICHVTKGRHIEHFEGMEGKGGRKRKNQQNNLESFSFYL